MFDVNLAETKKLLQKNKLFILAVLAMVSVSVFVSRCKNQKCEECEVLEIKIDPIKKFSSDKDKMKFMSNHKFNGDKIDFNEFINNLAAKTYANISSIEILEESKISDVNVKQFKIVGLFWHDIFIFDFIEKLQDFSPGFLNILSIDINKFSNQISSQKPIMKLEVVCKVYQK